VTMRENLLRGEGNTAKNAAKVVCQNGHAYDEKNTHIRPTGQRVCRACGRDRAKAKYAIRKEARCQHF
jgi:hypothetical protein